MTATIIASITTLVAALAGVTVTSLLNARSTRVATDRLTVITAAADLFSALEEHRGRMWHRGLAQLAGDAGGPGTETRKAISGPLAKVTMLAPELTPVAETAAAAAYAMRIDLDDDQRTIRTRDDLTTARLAAKTAADTFRAAARTAVAR